jgi:hypothetical protein
MTIDDETLIEFELQGFDEGDDEYAERVARQVREGGGEAQITGEGSGFDIAFVPIILGAIALVGLIHVVKNLVDDFQVGVVVDARGDKVVTTKDRSLPRGTVVLIAKDGDKVTLEQPDKETLADAMAAAVKAGG